MTPGDSKAQGELVMVTHVCNPSTHEAEAGGMSPV